jgi:pantoate--beta-alanine ligase
MSHHIPIVRTVRELRAALEGERLAGKSERLAGKSERLAGKSERLAGKSIGLVPTMGALHAGHSSLIACARERCDFVVVSVFVNPSQFDRAADLQRYPRQMARDTELAAAAGADLVFAPSVEEVYPDGFATQVAVLGITDRLEGAMRGAEHFRGVATVVTKLLVMALPDVAFFGQKDAQQVLVIRRLVADLNLPVRIEVCPTVREADGLALSSRNAQLSPRERSRALALYAGLSAAADLAAAGERAADVLLSAARAAMREHGVTPEYLVLVDPESLEPLARLDGPALLAVAAHLGSVRLIDNVTLEPSNYAAPSSPSKTGDGTSTRKVPACSA